ncbi:MAG: hypothetical protein ACSHXY_00210 [Alphaproteobacteria bacterium]
MHFDSLFLALIAVTCLQARTAYADQPICHDFSSKIEPDMQRFETDFTKENYRLSQNMLKETIPQQMEKVFEHNKKYPKMYDRLFQGEVWLAHANASAAVKGYVLKLEYLAASPQDKEPARIDFCKFVVETPYYD